MKNELLSPAHSTGILEELEARIAPATFVVGGDVNYSDSPFVNATGGSAHADIAEAFAGATKVYYITLAKGDEVSFDNGSEVSPWVNLTGGNAYAFFTDLDGNDMVTQDELTGLSLGGAAAVKVNGDVNGSIITNLDAAGVFTSTNIMGEIFLGLSGGKSNYFATVDVTGAVTGSIFSAGKITNVHAGSVGTIATGTSTNGLTISLAADGGIGTFSMLSYNPALKEAGGSISNVNVGSAEEILAGDGGVSGRGGSIDKVTIFAQSPGLDILIRGGGGGDGDVTSLNGGAGGKISNVEVHSDLGPWGAPVEVDVLAGNGGNAATAGTKAGNGGVGGSVQNINIGAHYDKSLKEWRSDESIPEGFFNVLAGFGGTGKAGGAGGIAKGVHVIAENSSIDVGGGDGGDTVNIKGAKGGAGGAASDIVAINFTTDDALGSMAIVAGGAGGDNTFAAALGDVSGKGGAGGGVFKVIVGGLITQVAGGTGGLGASGGAGGDVIDATYAGNVASDTILVSGGMGGDGTLKTGGKGGAVSDFLYSNSQYATMITPGLTGGPLVLDGEGGSETIGTHTSVSLVGSFDDVTLNGTVYGDVTVGTANITGDLIINGNIYNRVILTPGTSIAGDLTINGSPGFGLYLFDGTDYISYGDDPAAFAGLVAGTITVSDNDPAIPAWKYIFSAIAVASGAGGTGETAGGDSGSVQKVSINHVVPGIFKGLLWAASSNIVVGSGPGGDGTRSDGGDSGKVSLVTVAGTIGAAPGTGVVVLSGNGGTAVPLDSGGDPVIGESGNGGASGSVSKVTLNLDAGGNPFPASSGPMIGIIAVASGFGGDSESAGKGGNSGDVSSIVASVPGGIAIAAGFGGGSSTSNVGKGGSVSNVTISSDGSHGDDFLFDVMAGSAGLDLDLVDGTAKAGTGGSVKGVKFDLDRADGGIFSGLGSAGGASGSVENISDTPHVLSDGRLLPANYDLVIGAGNGSVGANGVAGAGGSVKKVTLVVPADGRAFEIKTADADPAGKPAAGGAVNDINILDKARGSVLAGDRFVTVEGKVDYALDPTLGSVLLSSGNGGDSTGSNAGGNGGNIQSVKWAPWDPAMIDALTRSLTLGTGGTSVSGPAGANGKAISVNVIPA